MDENGLFYWLGTNGQKSKWKNPAELGLVRVTSSKLGENPTSAPAHSICGRQCVRCVTEAKPNMWFMVDLKNLRLQPTHYTLMHYSSWDTEALRTWRFEASNDGRKWAMLKNHVNDAALNKKGGTYTWQIGRAVQQECRDRSRMPSSA
eukprot:TRINITY_DN15575_c0_g1_i2.p1 TRINITY_DN15575_c0_g1~~TRINITY_DN15575_c0_g1_i2.p1  ORF type:complete len:148 (-),score=16.56 TRINITY_DN15575_c0_g1_i2:11-454(-)